MVVVVGAHGGVGRCAVELAARSAPRSRSCAERMTATCALGAACRGQHRRSVSSRPADGACVSSLIASDLRPSTHRCDAGVGGRLVVVGNIDEQVTELQLGRSVVYGLQVVGSSGATEAELRHLLAWHAERPFTSLRSMLWCGGSEQAMAALRAVSRGAYSSIES